MLVCWRGVYLSLRSSTQTCTYIKDKNKKKCKQALWNAEHTSKDKRIRDNNTLSPSPGSRLPPPPSSLLLPAATVGYQSLRQSILPTSTPLPFKYQALRWEPEEMGRNVLVSCVGVHSCMARLLPLPVDMLPFIASLPWRRGAVDG